MRVGLFGIGQMGRNHFKVLRRLGHAVRVYDPDIDEINTHDLVGISIFGMELEKLIEWSEAFIIATPTETHYQLLYQLADAGKPILCEKPLCETSSLAEDVVEAFGIAKIPLHIGFTERHNPVIRKIKEMLDEKNPEIYHVEINRVGSLPPERYRQEGAVLDIGIHDYDLTNHLFGSASLLNSHCMSSGGIMVFSHAILEVHRFPVIVKTSWIDIMKRREIFIYTEDELWMGDLMERTLRVSDRKTGKTDRMPFAEEPLEIELREFFEHPEVSSDPGIGAIRLAEEIRGQ